MKRLIGFTLVLVSFNTVAAIYKQVDDKGRTIYSDQPSSSGKAQRVEIAPGPSSSEVDAAVRAADAMKQGIDQRLADKALRQSALDREVARKRQALKEAEAALAAGKDPGGDEWRGVVRGTNSVANGGTSANTGFATSAVANISPGVAVLGGTTANGGKPRHFAVPNRGYAERVQALEAAVQAAKHDLAIAEENARDN